MHSGRQYPCDCVFMRRSYLLYPYDECSIILCCIQNSDKNHNAEILWVHSHSRTRGSERGPLQQYLVCQGSSRNLRWMLTLCVYTCLPASASNIKRAVSTFVKAFDSNYIGSHVPVASIVWPDNRTPYFGIWLLLEVFLTCFLPPCFVNDFIFVTKSCLLLKLNNNLCTLWL